MYYDEFVKIIERIINGNFEKNLLEGCLEDTFDCEEIYDSDDEMITDLFFTLKHYASGEEDIGKNEWLYFLDCLLGKHKYNIEEKIRITTKPLTWEA